MRAKAIVLRFVMVGLVLGMAPAWTTAQVCAADRPPMYASLLWAIIAILSILTLRGFNNWYQQPASGRRFPPGRPGRSSLRVNKNELD